MSENISELRAVVTRTRWDLFAGLAILVIVVIAATLWLDQPETAVGGPVERVMAMVMLLAVILSLFMMLTVERLFRDMRTGAVPITSIAGGLQITGGIHFFSPPAYWPPMGCWNRWRRGRICRPNRPPE